MSEGHSPLLGLGLGQGPEHARDAALDRVLAAMASPAIPRTLVARMIAEIPRLPQSPPDEATGAAQPAGTPRPQLARWAGVGVAIAAGVCAIMLVSRGPADMGGVADAPMSAQAPATHQTLAAANAQPLPTASAPMRRQEPAARRFADDPAAPEVAAPPVREAEETPLVAPAQRSAVPLEPRSAEPMLTTPKAAEPKSADERVAVTLPPATVHETEEVEADVGAEAGTAIPAPPAGPRAPSGGMGFDGMGDMAGPPTGGLPGRR